jgi:hypothetical protein
VTDVPAAERYLRLGLQLGRHVEDVVDAYFGPPEIAAAVEAAPAAEPRTLVADAATLLDELEDGWLRDQVKGLRTYAGLLAGEQCSFADEAAGCYGVRPRHTEEAVFAQAHARLDALLPGDGSVAERHRRFEESSRVPAELVERTVAAAIEVARTATRGLVELPDGEGVEVEAVRDVPWMAFCAYAGGGRSRISVNADLPMPAMDLLTLAIHETYPGHHTERACKEQLLVRGRGLLEETIVLVPTVQSLVSEGIAKLAPSLILGSDAGEALAGVIHAAGVDFDLARALAVGQASDALAWAQVNAAMMLHDAGAGEADVRAYLEHWGLMGPALSAHMIRFLGDPTSRTYIVTYPAGRLLCESYVAGDPGRFRRLLTEQVRIGELLAASAASGRLPHGLD